MRLAGKHIRGLYEEHDVNRFLVDDAIRLKQWIEDRLKTKVLVDGRELKEIEPGSPFLRLV
jgi:hypothetical protein